MSDARRFRRWWAEPYRKVDDSEWPYVHFVGVRGRIWHKFFNLSLGWGTRPGKPTR